MKYIRYTNGAYRIDKRANNERISASFDNMEDAINVRDIYIRNEWVLDLTSPSLFLVNEVYYLLYKPERILQVLCKSRDKQEVLTFQEEYIDTDYIHKEKNVNKWRIMKSIKNKNEWFGSYNTLEEAIKYRDMLRQHGWNKEYFEKIYADSDTKRNEYIYHTRGGYTIKRTRGEVQLTYGTYKTLEEARKKRDELKQDNWAHVSDKFITKLFNLWWVKKDTTIDGIPHTNYYNYYDKKENAEKVRDYYIENGFPDPLFTTDVFRYIIKQGENYYIEKTHNGVKKTYPCSKSLLNATVLRDILEKHNWNPPLGQYEYHNKTYTLDLHEEKYVLELSHEREQKYITLRENGNYRIKHLNKYYGTYKTFPEAKAMLELLQAINWNKEIYDCIHGKINKYIHKIQREYWELSFQDVYANYKDIDHARIIRDYLIENQGIPYDDCITKTNTGYLVRINIPPFFKYKKIYKNYDVAKQQVKDYVLYGINGRAEKRHIRIINNKYTVSRERNSKYTIPTDDLDETKILRDILVDNQWKIPTGDYTFNGKTYYLCEQNGRITLNRNNVKRKLPRNIRIGNGGYILRKIINGQTCYYGTYHTLKDALDMKKELIKHDWSKEYYEEHKPSQGYKRKQDLPQYIRKSNNNKYEIVKYMEGKLMYFGRYDTLEEAKKAKDEIIKNDWSIQFYKKHYQRRKKR